VLDMAGSISAGRPWQGREVQQGDVVMIVAEGRAGIGKRIKAYRQKHGPFGRLHVLPRPVQAKDVKAWRVLVAACERLAPVFVVIDTQHRVTVGLEENSSTDMGYYIAAVGAIKRATGACVLTLHHTGRKGGDARGSSALDGAQDTELTIVPDPQDKMHVKLLMSKQKDVEEGEPIDLHFASEQVGVDERGRPVTSLVVLAPDPFRQEASGPELPDPGQEVDVPEPQRWAWAAIDHNRKDNTRRVLQVLATVGGQAGLTKAECCRIVRERWYGGRPLRARRGDGVLSNASWDAAWDEARHLSSASGEELVIKPDSGAARFAINPVAVAELKSELGE
jgi:hypothetical protein